MIGWMNCAAREAAPWEYWLPIALDGLVDTSVSVSGSDATEWRVWRDTGHVEHVSTKRFAFAFAEGSP